MPIDEFVREIRELGQFLPGVGIAALAAIVLGTTGYVITSRMEGRRAVKQIAPYLPPGILPQNLNMCQADYLAQQVMPIKGKVSVPVSLPNDQPLSQELTAYFRHPAGVGSKEALHYFFSQPAVLRYLMQPKSLTERLSFG